MAVKKTIPRGLYAITGEVFTQGRGNLYCITEMLKAGVGVVQYREKTKTLREKLEEAQELRLLCREFDALFIVNDHIDIALLTDADGVHIGQDDLPVSAVRELLGEEKIIGVSTHSPEDVRQAIRDGADYIGVGPLFKTTTKDTPPVGLEYLEFAVENVNIPFVAIGGVKERNIDAVIERGAKRICLVSELLEAEDIGLLTKKLIRSMEESRGGCG